MLDPVGSGWGSLAATWITEALEGAGFTLVVDLADRDRGAKRSAADHAGAG